MVNTKNKTYEISKLSQICNIVNDDNIDLILSDFGLWLRFYNSAIKKVRKENIKGLKKLTNSEIAKATFNWTDDGVSELSAVHFTSKETGETTKVKLK
jgi:hypothetical protein